MPLVPKLLLAPGTYCARDRDGNPVPYEITSDDVRQLYQTGKGMLRAGLSVPVPKEHQNYQAMTPEERLAARIDHNAGWVSDYKLTQDGRLYSVLDIPDKKLAAKLDKTVKWVSPEIDPEYIDGDGRVWKNAITHVALTLQPVWNAGRQEPFAPVGATPAGWDGAKLMSLTSNTQAISLCDASKGSAIRMSLDVLLERDGLEWKPKYPARFAWVHDPTKRTANRWKNTETGKVKYQKGKPKDAGGEKPSETEGKSDDKEDIAKKLDDALASPKKRTAADEFGPSDPAAEKRANEHAEKIASEEELRAGARTDVAGKPLDEKAVQSAKETGHKKGLSEAKEHDFDLPAQVNPQAKGYSKDLHKVATPEIRGIIQKHDLGKYGKDLKLADKTLANARSVYSRWAKGGTQTALSKIKEAIDADSKRIAKGDTHNKDGVPYAARMLAYRHMLDWADQDHDAKAVGPETSEYQANAKKPFADRLKDIDRSDVRVNGEQFRTGRERFVAHTVRGLIDTGAVPMGDKERAKYLAAMSPTGTATIIERDANGQPVLDANGKPKRLEYKFSPKIGTKDKSGVRFTDADERKKYVASVTQSLAHKIASGDFDHGKLEKVLSAMSAEGQGTLKPDEFRKLAKETKRFSLNAVVSRVLSWFMKKPAMPVHNSRGLARFSSGESPMAEEYKGDLDLDENDGGEGEGSPEVEEGTANEFEACKDYLDSLGINLPDDTTPENFITHLRIALHALTDGGEGAKADDNDEGASEEPVTPEAPQTMLMSLKSVKDPFVMGLIKQREHAQKGERDKKIGTLLTAGAINKTQADQLRRESSATRFAITKAGEPVAAPIDHKLDFMLASPLLKERMMTRRLSTASVEEPPVENDGKVKEVIGILSGKAK